MKRRTQNRILVALGALLLLPAFVTPLWTIKLVAPQYPEGLGMYIGVSDVVGHEPHDLQNINILNHYIGMQPIEPEAIPELEYMPLILGVLVATGLLAALVGRRWVMAGWLAALLVAGVAGMVDFYQWKYDYGHNLSPDAPIKVPGMTYQPPLIGKAQLLNITATSWPHLGTLFLTLGALAGLIGVFRSFRGAKQEAEIEARAPGKGTSPRAGDASGAAGGRDASTPSSASLAPGAILLLALLGACGPPDRGAHAPDVAKTGVPGTDRIVYGEAEDPYCGGTVEQVRWGGEIRTRSGDALRFRSIECLAAYLLEGRLPAAELERVGVVDFPHGWALLRPEDAIFLRTPNLASPTRLNLMAISTDRMAINLQEAYTGELMAWEEVLAFVAREWDVTAGAARAGGSAGR